MDELIEQRREAILAIAERHGVTDVRVFGSMARGTANEESDVDLLVRLLPGTSLLDLGGAGYGCAGVTREACGRGF